MCQSKFLLPPQDVAHNGGKVTQDGEQTSHHRDDTQYFGMFPRL